MQEPDCHSKLDIQFIVRSIECLGKILAPTLMLTALVTDLDNGSNSKDSNLSK